MKELEGTLAFNVKKAKRDYGEFAPDIWSVEKGEHVPGLSGKGCTISFSGDKPTETRGKKVGVHRTSVLQMGENTLLRQGGGDRPSFYVSGETDLKITDPDEVLAVHIRPIIPNAYEVGLPSGIDTPQLMRADHLGPHFTCFKSTWFWLGHYFYFKVFRQWKNGRDYSRDLDTEAVIVQLSKEELDALGDRAGDAIAMIAGGLPHYTENERKTVARIIMEAQ